MLFKQLQKNKGFTFVEILVIVAVLLVAWAFLFMIFHSMNKTQAIDKDRLLLSTTLHEAKILTLAGKDESSFGVHFEETGLILFEGNAYDPDDAGNRTFYLSPHSQISDINLSSGGSDIIFQRLTGEVEEDGTVTVSLKTDPSVTRSITVWPTGIID